LLYVFSIRSLFLSLSPLFFTAPLLRAQGFWSFSDFEERLSSSASKKCFFPSIFPFQFFFSPTVPCLPFRSPSPPRLIWLPFPLFEKFDSLPLSPGVLWFPFSLVCFPDLPLSSVWDFRKYGPPASPPFILFCFPSVFLLALHAFHVP